MADVPHFSLPFDFEEVGGVKRVAELEQESLEEIVACVEAILRIPRGWREELPEFGISDPVFTNPDYEDLRRTVGDWEPRAEVELEGGIDPFDEGLSRARIQVQVRES